MRQIVLDTETTGLEPSQGHRIIEIGCVELIDRKLTGNHYHQYINPEREIDEGAIAVHGISNEFLVDKPAFRDIVAEFIVFIKGAELVIHNAPFDVGFINHEFNLLQNSYPDLASLCRILDTLALARKTHPGQKNNLDALCKRYDVANAHRELHGALLDAEILADVYLRMTGGQVAMLLEDKPDSDSDQSQGIRPIARNRAALKIINATPDEIEAHQQRLAAIDKSSGGACVWLRQHAESN
ncbi:MAG: DNA polymerase III subunit epsilon [Gammaproteobacteria bacterium]|nr:DNA polymerase III subunit epsilon [Gammaproteobacteria bacterium]